MVDFRRSRIPPVSAECVPLERAAATEQLRVFQTQHFVCDACSQAIEFVIFDPFTLTPCPYCDSLLFVPAKIGPYFLYRPLGGGGMGSVYLSVSEDSPGELFAVKVLPREHRNNETMCADLLHEARTAGMFLDVPGCENGVEYGVADDEHFFAMEFIPGPRLDQIIDSQERLEPTDALRMALELVDTDQRICTRGYLFRDLKPENVILENERRARLIDFGLCISHDEMQRDAEEDGVIGSLHYLPPERLAGLPEGEHSEIYSLGLVLFHAISGHTFFSDGQVQALIDQHLHPERLAVAAHDMPDDVPAPVCDLLDAMIRQRPDERPRSFEELRGPMGEAYRLVAGHDYRP